MMSSSLTMAETRVSFDEMGDTLARSRFAVPVGETDVLLPNRADTTVLPMLARRACLSTSAEESLPLGPGLMGGE